MLADQDKLRARLELFRNGRFVFKVDWELAKPEVPWATSCFCFGFALRIGTQLAELPGKFHLWGIA